MKNRPLGADMGCKHKVFFSMGCFGGDREITAHRHFYDKWQNAIILCSYWFAKYLVSVQLYGDKWWQTCGWVKYEVVVRPDKCDTVTVYFGTVVWYGLCAVPGSIFIWFSGRGFDSRTNDISFLFVGTAMYTRVCVVLTTLYLILK